MFSTMWNNFEESNTTTRVTTDQKIGVLCTKTTIVEKRTPIGFTLPLSQDTSGIVNGYLTSSGTEHRSLCFRVIMTHETTFVKFQPVITEVEICSDDDEEEVMEN